MIRTFGSLCSGIEAASFAFAPLGWKAAWLSEVDVAASQVLARNFGATAPVFQLDPEEEGIGEKERKARLNAIKSAARMTWGNRVTNWGDMTAVRAMVMMGEAEAPEILVAGTPCQGFSIAGLRGGLNDDRSNLALEYIRIVDAIDRRRRFNGQEPCITLWENVPGVLSDRTNGFGCVLAGLAGEDVPLVPSGRKWSDAGLVLGPKRAVAWRTLDAQYFGLAQRRRRVFVVASAREGFDPGAVLLEFDGLRRDSPPSRETGQEVARTLDARTKGGGFPGTDGATANHVIPQAVVGPDLTRGYRLVSFGEYADDDLASTMQSRDYKYVTDVVTEAWGISNQPTPKFARELSPSLDAKAEGGGRMEAVAYGFQPRIARNGRGDMGEVVNALTAEAGQTGKGDAAPCVAYTFPAEMSGTQFASEGDLANALSVKHLPAICFSAKDYGGDATEELAPTLRAMNHDGSHANGGGQLAVCVTGDITHALKAEGADASEDGTGRGNPIVPVSFRLHAMNSSAMSGNGSAEAAFESEVARCLDTNGGLSAYQGGEVVAQPVEVLPFNTTQITSPENGSNPQWGDRCFSLAAGNHPPAVALKSEGVIWAVRRLMPVECERLQGFPDNATRWLPDGKEAADGPRYRQLGNSWAIPCVAWIGARIELALRGYSLLTGATRRRQIEELL